MPRTNAHSAALLTLLLPACAATTSDGAAEADQIEGSGGAIATEAPGSGGAAPLPAATGGADPMLGDSAGGSGGGLQGSGGASGGTGGSLNGSGGASGGTGGSLNGSGGASGGTGGSGTGGSGGSLASGDYPDAVFVENGFGQTGDWQGYTFTVSSSGSDISPSEFESANLCVEGSLGSTNDDWAMVGWNIGQTVSGTGETGAALPVEPGGTGLTVSFVNNGGSRLRVQLNSDDQGGPSWCAEATTSPATFEWSDFRQNCWNAGGATYSPSTEVAQIVLQTYYNAEHPSEFDYCLTNVQRND